NAEKFKITNRTNSTTQRNCETAPSGLLKTEGIQKHERTPRYGKKNSVNRAWDWKRALKHLRREGRRQGPKDGMPMHVLIPGRATLGTDERRGDLPAECHPGVRF